MGMGGGLFDLDGNGGGGYLIWMGMGGGLFDLDGNGGGAI